MIESTEHHLNRAELYRLMLQKTCDETTGMAKAKALAAMQALTELSDALLAQVMTEEEAQSFSNG